MRRFCFAFLTMALIAGAIYSFNLSAKGRASAVHPGHPGHPIASIGEIFRRS